jgi:hypothetical protein
VKRIGLSLINQGVRRNLREAQRLLRLYAFKLDKEAWSSLLLYRYRQAIGQTNEMMEKLGVAGACGGCAQKGAGSCCFLGVENKYDEMLLLINALLGHPPPKTREIEGKCLFVGKTGCKLLARHYYCQHFLCDELKLQIGEAAVRRLNETVAQELAVGWEVEQTLRGWVRQHIERVIG